MATVKLFGVLRDRAGLGETEFTEDLTLLEILEHLGERYGSGVEQLLLEEKDGRGVKRQPVVILIGGMAQIDLERKVGREETVSIFPAVAGG
jgi:molybdopterin converting factor small subunit